MAKDKLPAGPTNLRKNLATGQGLQQAQDKALGKGGNAAPTTKR